MGFLPGLIFWVMLLRKPEASVYYRVELRQKGKSPFVLWHGVKDDVNAIARMVHRYARLPLEQELGLLDGEF